MMKDYFMNLERQLDSTGKAFFVKYYYYLADSNHYSTKDIIRLIKEDYSEKSKKSRISHAHIIFNNNLNIEALKIVLKSKVSDDIKILAKNILEDISD